MPADIKRQLPMPTLRSALDRSRYAPAQPPRTCPERRSPASRTRTSTSSAKGPCSTAVRRCWGSLWTDRAIAYRDRIGIEQAAVKIAVVVQRMINAEIAGVMFTADPVSGDRKTILVDASNGLGEAVVSGLSYS